MKKTGRGYRAVIGGIFTLIILYGGEVTAQSYNTVGGLRIGSRWGLTFKQRIGDKLTLEVIATQKYSRQGGAVDLCIEKHNPLLFKRFNLYYGGGFQVGWKNQAHSGGDNLAYGLGLVGGAELTIARLNISWDLLPTINLYNNERPVVFNSAVSIRYVIVKRKRKWRLFKRHKNRRKKRDKDDGFFERLFSTDKD